MLVPTLSALASRVCNRSDSVLLARVRPIALPDELSRQRPIAQETAYQVDVDQAVAEEIRPISRAPRVE